VNGVDWIHDSCITLHKPPRWMLQGCKLVAEEGGKAEGRALFASSFQAQDALGRIDGTVEFDKGCVLKATMATEDLELEGIDSPKKVGPMPSIPPIVTSASMVEDSGRMAGGYLGTGYISPTGINGGTILPFAAPFGYPQHGAQPHIMTTPRAYAPVKNEKDNPPCNTLFIGNLGESVNENELRCAFGPQPGFQQLKVVRGPRGISAFIEFADVTTAAAAHETQQGLILASSDRGPIRVQFSKNPFGRKRDGSSTINGGMLISPQAYGAYALPMTYPAGTHPGQSVGGPGPYYSVPPPVSGPLHGYHHGGLVPAGMAMQSIEAG
jgi:hypothetical protein